MWATGAAVGLMSLAEVLHDDFLFACVLMLPLPILVFSILSIDLVHRVMLEFEYKILSVFQIIMLIAAVNILWDRRIIFWICYGPSLQVSLLMDAYPAKYRALFVKLWFCGTVLILLTFDVILTCSSAPYHDVTVNVGRISISGAPFCFTTSITLLLFCYRQLRASVWSPGNLVLIKSAVKTHHVHFPALGEEEFDSESSSYTDYSLSDAESVVLWEDVADA